MDCDAAWHSGSNLTVDHSVLIDHRRGNQAARKAVLAAAQPGAILACSVLTKVEVLAGMRPAEEQVTRLLLNALAWHPVTDELAEHAGQLANQFLYPHPGVDPADYLIAATTISHGASLWTRNVRRFPMFEGLQPPY